MKNPRHPGAGRGPVQQKKSLRGIFVCWVPAFAGMTIKKRA